MTASRPNPDHSPTPPRRHPVLVWAASLTGARVLAATAILIAMGLLAAMGEVINRDGALYVRSAQAFLEGGLGAAIQVYDWPAYSILFALVSELTDLHLEDAAHLVNTALWVLMADAFIRLFAGLEPERGRPWVAALVFLSFPKIPHGLEIYRDWGYLAFSLSAIVSLCRFWRDEHGRTRDALGWQAGMVAATLFRVEGAVLLVLAPLALLLQDRPRQIRLRRSLLIGAWVLPAVAAGAALAFSGTVTLGRLHELLMYGNPETAFAAFNEVAEQIGTVLNKYSDDFAPYMLASGIATMTVWMALKNLGGFLLLVTAWGIHRFGLPPRTRGYGILYALLGIVALTLIVFFAQKLILVSRYALLASCLLMIITTALASRLLDVSEDRRETDRWIRGLLLAGLVIGCAVNIIRVEPDYKAYIREAGQWLAAQAPPDVPVLTNDRIIDYYADRPLGPEFETIDDVRAYLEKATPPFYIALRVDDHLTDQAHALFAEPPVKALHSARVRETLLIFRVAPPAPEQSAGN